MFPSASYLIYPLADKIIVSLFWWKVKIYNFPRDLPERMKMNQQLQQFAVSENRGQASAKSKHIPFFTKTR